MTGVQTCALPICEFFDSFKSDDFKEFGSSKLMPEYSKKKLAKAYEILKMISENPNISIDELRIALDVTDRTIARYISELKDKGIIERKGPDNGGRWKIR